MTTKKQKSPAKSTRWTKSAGAPDDGQLVKESALPPQGALALAVDDLSDAADLFPSIQHVKKRAFLTAYATCCSLRGATYASGVDWKNHYFWRERDPDYAAAFERAHSFGRHALEDEATRRAMGWNEQSIDAEGNVTERYRASDTLLIVRLKSEFGDKYKERHSVEHDVSPAMGTLLSVWQELREHPDRAHPSVPGGGQPMLAMGGELQEKRADWDVDAVEGEIEDTTAL